MQELRIVLIVVGIILIVALLAHGFWSSRKNRPVKLKDAKTKAKSKKKKADLGPRDDQGFDEFGLGEARVIGDPLFQDLSESEESVSNANASGLDESEAHGTISNPPPAQSAPSPYSEPALTQAEQVPVNETPSERREPAFSFSALDDEPSAVNVEPTPAAQTSPSPATNPTRSAFELQIEDAIPEPVAANPEPSEPSLSPSTNESRIEPELSASTDSEVPSHPQPEDVFVLNVVAQRGKAFSGLDVVNCLDSHGLFFGEMDIFHRHEDNSGHGSVVYSVANMLNPGVFNMDTIKEFETRGMTFFMAVPGPGEPYKNFNMMHTTALAIARELNGLLVDDQRNPLTQQTLNHYQQRVREYERKQLLAAQ
ncbi:cell division protein ZipA [Alginatibacterium sediminis]|uniref:Cell division protein ZipA n=1 Tax=Alginatibacterium sediminis TaxID=2164068 RepID=A0A420EBM4_9ALTE|nr:cell division protein ZipA [Alginatibacterium sediminis]RKF18071.1 cell division protein ZipA [Alginatibacterium sediminis]